MKVKGSLYEQGYNITWVLFAIWICVKSVKLNLWGVDGPGTGFFPFGAGLFIGVCGLLLLELEWAKDPENRSEEKFWEHPDAWKRILYALLGFVAMALFMPILGFLLTSILVMTLMIRVIRPQKIAQVLFISVISCFPIYLFFRYIFEIKLPRGLLGF